MSGPYWYRKTNGLIGGPHTLDEMRRVYAQGALARTQQVSIDGGESWRSAGEFPELFQRPAPLAAPPPPSPPPLLVDEGEDSLLSESPSGDDFGIDLGTPSPPDWTSPPPGVAQPPIVNIHNSTPSEPQSNGMAIAGFVLSLLGCTCITALLGLIFSLVALNSPNRANRGLAIAGAIIGGLWILAWIGYFVLVVVLAAANAPL